MTKLRNLADGLKAVGTGATLPYIASTSLRLSDKQHSKAMDTDQREHTVPGLLGYTDWLNSKTHTLLYCLGMGASLGLTGGVLNYGIDRLAHEQDPTVLLSELGAIVFGNMGSLVYERLRRRNSARTA